MPSTYRLRARDGATASRWCAALHKRRSRMVELGIRVSGDYERSGKEGVLVMPEDSEQAA